MVGANIKLNDIILTNEHALAGRFSGQKCSATSLKKWVTNSWMDIIQHCPEVFILLRGWISFKFHEPVDSASILSGSWRWEGSGLLLKRWSPLFDPRTERYDTLPIWVKLLNLPFEFWSLDFFKLVANSLGTFLEADLSFLHFGVCFLGKI